MNNIDRDIEEFYTEIEKGMNACGKLYIRPPDYKERYIRILNGTRNTAKINKEGKTGYI
jgi:hypothetical protein